MAENCPQFDCMDPSNSTFMYTPYLDPLGTSDVTTIHYVNSYPGAGKTYAALNIAEATLNDPTANYVLVYAAPTLRLLSQFRADLLRRKPAAKSRVHLIDSESDDLAVAQQLEGKLNGASVGSFRVKKAEDGDVIMCTHDCLLRVRLDMPGKDRISLIFDEARQCVQTSLTVKAPAKVLQDLKQCVEVIEPREYRGGVLARWSWKSGAEPMTEHRLKRIWESAQRPKAQYVTRLHKVLEHVRNGTLHVWVAFHEEQRKGELQNVEVQITLSPQRLFYGYGRVLILSAFFNHSQMYYLLKRGELAGKISQYAASKDATLLIDVSDQLIRADRIERIRDARLACATMTYIFEEESLTKAHINQGIVIPYMPTWRRDEVNETYTKLRDQEPGAIKNESYKKFLARARNPAFEMTSAAIPRYQLISDLKPSKYSVIRYMSKAATALQSKWLETQAMEAEPLLLCINSKDSSDSHSGLWEKENLDKLIGDSVIRVPVVSQGLNEWRRYHTAAFLATLKLTPDQINFFKAIIPDYNPDLDRTVDQCIQFLFRSGARVAKSDKPLFFVVSDQRLAEQVASVLDSGMRIVSPTDLVPTWKKKSILLYSKGSAASVAARESSRYKSAAYKQAKKVQRAAVRSGPEFREFNRLDVAVRRAEQAGKDTSALIEQRERARAAWKAAKQPSK